MNTKRVQAAEGVILAALKTRQTAAGIAIALESACLLQSPESAAEQVELRDTLAKRTELLRDVQAIARRRFAEATGRKAYGDRLKAENAELWARVRELEAERHSTNEALSDAAEALRVQRDRIAELEAERAELIRQRDQIAMDTMRAITLPTVYSCLVCGEGLDDENISDFCSDQCEVKASAPAHQAEDPHDSPLHHDYAIGHDLPPYTDNTRSDQ